MLNQLTMVLLFIKFYSLQSKLLNNICYFTHKLVIDSFDNTYSRVSQAAYEIVPGYFGDLF